MAKGADVFFARVWGAAAVATWIAWIHLLMTFELFVEEIWRWIPRKLSFRYISFHGRRLQMMLWHHNVRVNSHQRWKQTRFRVCFHLWCELTSTMNVTEWQVPWHSWLASNWISTSDKWDLSYICLSRQSKTTNFVTKITLEDTEFKI